MSENKKLTRHASVVGVLTLVSRIFGLVRDVVLANFFGAGLLSDAFFVAFRIPNLLRRLFAEGAFSVAFIPVFSGYVASKSQAETLLLYRRVTSLLLVVVMGAVGVGIFAAPLIVKVFAPGFAADKFALTVDLTRIMFPYILLISLVSLAGGVLNSKGRFAAPAFAPTLLNLAMIASVLWVAPNYPAYAVQILCLGVLGGGLLQLLCMWPGLRGQGFSFSFRWQPRDAAILTIVKNMGPAILGAAVYQINILIVTNLASFLEREGSISYLYYADRIVQFPLGLFAVAMGTAIFPMLSKAVALDDLGKMRKTLNFGIRILLYLTIPATVALMYLRLPILSTIFQHGKFTPLETGLTAQALLCAAIGLSGVSVLTLVVRGFYSLGDTKTPFRVASYSLLVNLVLCLLFWKPLQHAGLALAPALAATYNCIHLYILLRLRIGDIGTRGILFSGLKFLGLAIAMLLGLWFLQPLLPMDSFIAGPVMVRAICLLNLVLGGLVVYLGLTYVFRKWLWPELKTKEEELAG